MTGVPCNYCDNDNCERVPYPQGERYICQRCGEEYYSVEAVVFREKQKKRLHELMETINKTSEGH